MHQVLSIRSPIRQGSTARDRGGLIAPAVAPSNSTMRWARVIHPQAGGMRMRSVRGMLVALAASTMTLMVTCAAAQAGWSDAAPTMDYHCGASIAAPHAPPVAFQSCAIVRPAAGGAWVQAVTKVSNTSDNPNYTVSPTGYSRVWLDGAVLRNDNCGAVAITGARTKWCWGGTQWVAGRGRDVYATGYVWVGAGVHDAVNSPHTNGILIYLSKACHNAAGSTLCRENVGCDGYGENAGSGVIARWAANSFTARGYMVRIGTGSREANISESNALGALIHIPIHSNAGTWDCNAASTAFTRGGTLVMHYGGPADNQLAWLMRLEVGNRSPGTSDGIAVRRDLAEITQTSARVAYLEAAYHTFGPDVAFLRNPGAWASSIAQAVDRCRGFPRNGATPTRTKECSW